MLFGQHCMSTYLVVAMAHCSGIYVWAYTPAAKWQLKALVYVSMDHSIVSRCRGLLVQSTLFIAHGFEAKVEEKNKWVVVKIMVPCRVP